MAKKRLNRKVALIGFVVFVFVGYSSHSGILIFKQRPEVNS